MYISIWILGYLVDSIEENSPIVWYLFFDVPANAPTLYILVVSFSAWDNPDSPYCQNVIRAEDRTTKENTIDRGNKIDFLSIK